MNYKDLKDCMSRRRSGKDKEYTDRLFGIIDNMCVASVDRDKCFVGDRKTVGLSFPSTV